MIVRSTHAAPLTPKAALPSNCRKTRSCTLHSKPVCGLERSSFFGICTHRPSVQVAAQEAGQVKPRFAKQLGLIKEEDAAQEADIGGREEPHQARFAKQLGLAKENKHDEPDQLEEQLDIEQLDVQHPDVEHLDVEHLDVEQPAAGESAPEPSPEDLGLVPNKEGYQVIKLEGCDFLLATTSDGSFDLSDAYVQDNETGVYAQPDVTSGELPATAQQYAQIQWQEEYLGDMVYDKPPKFLVKRVYLVHITQLEPRRLDLETVWVLDGENRSIYKAQVDRSTDSQDPTEMILRIRRDGSLLIDSAEEMPTPDELILQIEFGEGPGAHGSPQRWRMDDPDTDLNDPIDAIGDDFDEPDVPPVDLA